MRSTGWIGPISLLAAITETRAVHGPIAEATASGSTAPLPSTGSTVTAQPSASMRRTASRTDGCSTAVVTT